MTFGLCYHRRGGAGGAGGGATNSIIRTRTKRSIAARTSLG